MVEPIENMKSDLTFSQTSLIKYIDDARKALCKKGVFFVSLY